MFATQINTEVVSDLGIGIAELLSMNFLNDFLWYYDKNNLFALMGLEASILVNSLMLVTANF